jgi:hypothetical protein
MLHDAPLPPWPGRRVDEIASRLDGECEWLIPSVVGFKGTGMLPGRPAPAGRPGSAGNHAIRSRTAWCSARSAMVGCW